MLIKPLPVFIYLFFLPLLVSCAGSSVKYKSVGLDEKTPSCQINDAICVQTHKFKRVDYEADDLLLTYDADKSADVADAVLKKYKLRAKRTDQLTFIKRNMVTAATNGQDPVDLVAAIKKHEKEVDASTNNFFTTASVVDSATGGVIYPMGMTGVPVARSRTRGNGVVIGMIDTPIDIDYNDSLHASIERIDLVAAGDANNRLHGTEVAGVMVSQNPRIGIAPEAKLIAISAFSTAMSSGGERRSNSGLVARALEIALKQNIDVLNLSFAGPSDPLVDQLVQAAVQKGIVVVASAGNGGPGAQPAYPAALPGVIAVTAVDKGETIFGRANRGDYIDLSAPGVGILTTAPGGTFHVSSGTSLATAHVSGVIALIMSLQRQGFQPELLNRTAVDLGQPGRDNDYGYGLISVARALSAIGQP